MAGPMTGGPMAGPRVELETEQTAIDDVDDVIGIAAELMRQEEGRLDREDLHEVGRELDIPSEYIEKARQELKRRRAEASKREAAGKARRKRTAVAAGVAALVVGAGGGIAYQSTASSLRERHAAVQARAAQVDNVRARKAAVVEQLADRPASPDKDAEIVGAENRIRVETKRYAEAAAAYNQATGGWFASWTASVAGLPTEVPVTLPP